MVVVKLYVKGAYEKEFCRKLCMVITAGRCGP